MKKTINRKQAVENVKAFLPHSPEIATIIEICDLYPLNSWKSWTDHLGNYLKITNKKKINSIVNSSSNKIDTLVTDLYFKAHPKKLSKMSTWGFVSFGRDNDNEMNISFIWLFGRDKRLRLISLSKNEWNKNQPPLSCGINTLRPIVKNINVFDYLAVDILRIQGPIAAKITKSWATIWPPNNKLKEKMLYFNEDLSNKIINDLEI